MNKEILRLAIPNIISNISVPLLSSVDTGLMGRLSAYHIGAVGIGSMIFNFIYWNFGFLRMGTTGMTAQAYGKKDEQAIILIWGRAMLVGLVIALLLLLGQWPIQEIGIYLLNVSEEQAPLVRTYFSIRIWAAPATLGLYAIIGWFFGLQNAIVPLVLTVSINILNIILSFFLVYYLKMEVVGVALGTVIAQYGGFILGLIWMYWKHRSYLSLMEKALVLEISHLRRFLSVNGDIFIRTFLLTLSFAWFYSFSAEYGAQVLAVNVILLQLIGWMSHGIDGFAFATESLVGKYAGAQQKEQVWRAIRVSFAWGLGFAALYAIGYGLFGQVIFRLFTNQTEVLSAAQPYLIWIAVFPLLSTPCYIWDGIFIGLTASKSMRNTMILAFAIFGVSVYTFGGTYGNHGLWLALITFMIARGVIQHLFFLRKGLALS